MFSHFMRCFVWFGFSFRRTFHDMYAFRQDFHFCEEDKTINKKQNLMRTMKNGITVQFAFIRNDASWFFMWLLPRVSFKLIVDCCLYTISTRTYNNRWVGGCTSYDYLQWWQEYARVIVINFKSINHELTIQIVIEGEDVPMYRDLLNLSQFSYSLIFCVTYCVLKDNTSCLRLRSFTSY